MEGLYFHSARLHNHPFFNRDQLNRTTAEDIVFDIADDAPEHEDGAVEKATESSSFLGKAVADVDAEGAAKDLFCLASRPLFRNLFNAALGDKCPKCSCGINVSETMIGSCLLMKWQCAAVVTHRGSYSSQHRFTNIYTGNIKIAAATLLSGSSPRKTRMLFKFADCGAGSENSFYQ